MLCQAKHKQTNKQAVMPAVAHVQLPIGNIVWFFCSELFRVVNNDLLA